MYREIPYNFGALPPLPEGYQVMWFDSLEHYMAIGPGDNGVWPDDYWESPISWNPYQCRRWAFAHAAKEDERS